MAKQSLLQKFGRLSEAKKLLVFLLVFAVIGGGYMAYSSFAATPQLSTPCYSFQGYGSLEKNTQVLGVDGGPQRCQQTGGHPAFWGNKPTQAYLQIFVEAARPLFLNDKYCANLDCNNLLGLRTAYTNFFADDDKAIAGNYKTTTGSVKDIMFGGKKALLFERVTNNTATNQVVGYHNYVVVDTGFYQIPSSNFNCKAESDYDKKNNCKLNGIVNITIGINSQQKNEMNDFYNTIANSWQWKEPAVPICSLEGKGPIRINGTQIQSQATLTCNAKYANAVVTGSIFQWDNNNKSVLKNSTTSNQLNSGLNLVVLDNLKPKCRNYSVEYSAYLTDNDGQTKVGKTYSYISPVDSKYRNICNTR